MRARHRCTGLGIIAVRRRVFIICGTVNIYPRSADGNPRSEISKRRGLVAIPAINGSDCNYVGLCGVVCGVMLGVRTLYADGQSIMRAWAGVRTDEERRYRGSRA